MCTIGLSDDRSATIQATYCGDIASELLVIDQDISVLGATSRGVFLEGLGRWLVFLSYERFRSPLTVNLIDAPGSMQEVVAGQKGRVVSGKVLFKEINLVITTQDSRVWRAEGPMTIPLSKAERLAKVTHCAEFVLSQKPGVGLSRVLAAMFSFSMGDISSDTGDIFVRVDFSKIRKSIANLDLDAFTSMATSMLGAGQGLTPSGDDFMTGLILALNRWGKKLWPADNLDEANRVIVEAAYHRTTRLSANLIELAARGKGDERLIGGLDLLMSDIRYDPGALLDLLGWGASSGVDAFVGMAVALTS